MYSPNSRLCDIHSSPSLTHLFDFVLHSYRHRGVVPNKLRLILLVILRTGVISSTIPNKEEVAVMGILQVLVQRLILRLVRLIWLSPGQPSLVLLVSLILLAASLVLTASLVPASLVPASLVLPTSLGPVFHQTSHLLPILQANTKLRLCFIKSIHVARLE